MARVVADKDKKLQYGIWLGMPDSAKHPRTQQELAKELGVCEETLSRWKRDPFVEQAETNVLHILAGQHDLKIVNKLIENAEKGNVAAQRLYFQWRGQLDGQGNKAKPKEYKVRLLDA